MAGDPLENARESYDVVIVGSGLAAMTAANTLARQGRSVLMLEQHVQPGGLATWFNRENGLIFDISLHGFPVGMVKSCKRYWTQEIADSIVQLKNIRFDNPMFSLSTTFNRDDFTKLLTTQFGLTTETVQRFFDTARQMNFYDDQSTTTGQLFEKFFPGRPDVVRLLMEPITYANGSTLEDPALTYGIVFSNFMSKGVYTFSGGTDRLVRLMVKELRANGVKIGLNCKVEKVIVRRGRVEGVRVRGRFIGAKTVISNSNLKGTIFRLVGPEPWSADFLEQARNVRLNNSSTQVYMGLKQNETVDEDQCGDLLFSSKAPVFRTDLLLSKDITSRTYSFYYPKTRPRINRHFIVSSTNARYEDWADLPKPEYDAAKADLIAGTLRDLDKYVPGIRDKIDWIEASTPLTFERYTMHLDGASFGTKFEGLAISRGIPNQIAGLYHAGSVGIIMSGWLGAMNYGVIVANEADAYLLKDSPVGV